MIMQIISSFFFVPECQQYEGGYEQIRTNIHATAKQTVYPNILVVSYCKRIIQYVLKLRNCNVIKVGPKIQNEQKYDCFNLHIKFFSCLFLLMILSSTTEQ